MEAQWEFSMLSIDEKAEYWKCGKIASTLIVRATILGGIGVIQHTSGESGVD